MLKAKITGTIIILINTLWMFRHLRFMYLRQNPDIIWFSMYPNWLLIINSVIGFIGIIIGIKVFKERIKIVKGVVLSIALIILGVTLELAINIYEITTANK